MTKNRRRRKKLYEDVTWAERQEALAMYAEGKTLNTIYNRLKIPSAWIFSFLDDLTPNERATAQASRKKSLEPLASPSPPRATIDPDYRGEDLAVGREPPYRTLGVVR